MATTPGDSEGTRHGRGTGVLSPRRLASPQSLSCAIQHGFSLDSTDPGLLLIYAFSQMQKTSSDQSLFAHKQCHCTVLVSHERLRRLI